MKKFLKAMVFGCLMLSSLVGCDKEETNNQTNNNNTNNTTENNNNNNTVEAKLTGITLNADSVKKAYTYGDALDLTGLVVNANYDDNTSKAVTSYKTTPANGAALNSVGDVPVTVTYEGKTASFNVSVTKGLTGITLNTDAVKKVYNHNETLDLTGLVVTANYNDNTSEAVSTYTTDPTNGSILDAVGNKTITVTYEGKTNTFDITVNAVLTGITLNTDDVKKDYKHKEQLDLSNLKVFANYSDGTSREVTNFTTDPANGTVLNTIGNNRINVTYEGFTEFFGVNVAKKILRITLDTTNVKTVYRDGEQLDLTGLVVTAFYSDNTSEDVSAYVTTNYPNGHTFEVFGNIQVTVEYAGVSAKFECSCPPFSEEGTTVTVNLDKDISFGTMGVPNNAYISARGTKGSNFIPTMSLYRRSTAEGSMTHVNGATRFLNGDSIENVTAICGITKITVHGGNGYFNLYVGYRNDSLHEFLISESNNGDRIFDNIPNVNYFMLRGTHDDFPADISSIEIEYTRDENHAQVPGVAKTIDQVTVVNNTYKLGSKVITVSGNTASVNGDEYTFVGIEYLGYILYKSYTGKGILVKFNGTTEIEVIDVDNQYGGFTGTYSKIIPATAITMYMNGVETAENDQSNRISLPYGSRFNFSATCDANPVEDVSIELVDESLAPTYPYAGEYVARGSMEACDLNGSLNGGEPFDIIVDKLTISYGSNSTLNVIYKDHSSYDCYSGYDFSLSDVPINDNGIITFGNDVITIIVNTKTQKISVAYEDQYFIFFSDEVTYDFTPKYPPVANINDGVVRTTSNGNFHLVCRTSNNIVTYLYFTALAYVPATITLNSPDENVTMEIGETKQISVTFNEGATNKSLVYSSNNRKVATVKGTGVITAVAEGSAVITVSTSDGNSVSINVTVIAPSNNAITLSGKYDFYDEYDIEHHVEFEEEGAIIDDCYTLTLTNGQYVLDASTAYFVIEESNGKYYLHFYDEECDFYNNGVFYSNETEDSYELTAW